MLTFIFPLVQVMVDVCVTFLKIGDVDTLREHYDADIMIKAKWREPRLDKDKQVSEVGCLCYTVWAGL